MPFPRSSIALLVLLALLAPARAQDGEPLPEEPISILKQPGNLDMEDLAAVSARLKQRIDEKAELERTQPDDESRLRVLNTRIGILQSHEDFLKARKLALESRVSEADVQAARRKQEEAEAAQKSLDLARVKEELRPSSVPIETVRARLNTQTASVKEARAEADRAAERLRDRTADRDRLPAQQEAAREKRKAAIERIRRLKEQEKALQSRVPIPEKEFNLVLAEIEAWQQDARQQEIRLEFLDSRGEHLDRAVQRATHLSQAAATVLASAEALEAAIRVVLDERLAEESLELKERIDLLEARREAASEPSEKRRLAEEIENLRLQAERGKHRQSAAATEVRRIELEKLGTEAAHRLAEYEAKYAPDAPAEEQPKSEEVSEEIRRLTKVAATQGYLDEMDDLRRRRKEASARREELRARLDSLDVRLDDSVPPAVRKEREELLRSTIETLNDLITDLESSIELRGKVYDTRRQTLLLLRRENLFLRGKSLITWDSMERGLSDLAALPGWTAEAAAGVGAYLFSPENRGRLLTLLALVLLLAGLLLFLRRRILARIARVARVDEEGDGTVRRARIAILRLLAPLCVSLLLLLSFLGAWLLLPEPLPDGVRRILLLLGLLFSGFWFGRALNRVLVRGKSEAGKVLPFEDAAARWFGVGFSLFLWLTVVLVSLEIVLRELGYRNEGVLELVTLVYRFLVGLGVLVVLLRKQNLLGLIPDSGSRLARFLRVLVTALHPVLVLLVPGLLLLDVLRYDILAALIAGVALNTVAFAVLGYLVYRGLLLIVDRRVQVAEVADRRAPQSESQDARQVIQFGIFLLCLLGTIWAILAFSGTSLSELRTFFSRPLPLQGAAPEDPATWWNLLMAAFLLYLTFSVTRHLKKALQVFVLGRTKMDRGLQYTIVTLCGYVLVTIGVVLAARQVFDLTNFGYVVAALSVGIGFGLQEIVSNFISGIILLFERSLKVGDLIEVGDTAGIVTRIQVRSTTVVTRDNITITVPNRDFMTKNVVNFVGDDSKVRLRLPFGVSYSSDPERVREVILEVAREERLVLAYPAPEVWFRGFGDSSLDFELLAWVRDPVEQFRISSHLYYRIFAALGKAGIEIPFPQRDLHIRSSLPIPLTKPEPAPPEEE